MKKYLLLLGFIALASVKMYAQNVAFVNERKLLAALPGYEKATKTIDSIQKVYTADVNQKTNDLNQRINALLQPYKVTDKTTPEQLQAMLNEADKKKFSLLQDEGALLKKQIDQKQEDFNALYQKTVSPIANRANKIIQDHCKLNKIDALLKIDAANQSLLFYNESKDITDVLITKLK